MNPNLKWTLCRTIAGIGLITLAAATAAAGSTNTNYFSASSGGTGRMVTGKVDKASQLIGRDVLSSSDKRIGRIDDLVVDLDCGRVLYVVVRTGGFLSERRVAVPAGTFRPAGANWRISANQRQLTDAPRLTREQETQLENPTFVSNTFRYFNQTAWWDSPDVQFNNVHKLSKLIGMDVRDRSNEKVGAVSDLAIDLSAGRIICAIVLQTRTAERGGSLCALPPNALTASADRQSLNTSFDPDKLALGPHFEKDQWPDMTDPAWTARLYQYYGKQAYFDSGELRATGRSNAPPRIYHEPDEPKK